MAPVRVMERRRRVPASAAGRSVGPAASHEPAQIGESRRPAAGLTGRSDAAAQATRTFGRPHQGPDRPSQLGLIQVADDPGPLDETDLAVLLRDDDDERVGLLGDPESGPVAGPEALGVDRHLGQGQQGAGCEDGLVANDHRSVVERRLRREDRPDQVGADVGVQHDAGLGHLLEPGVAFQHDQRAVAVGRQQGGGPGDLLGDPVDGSLLRRRQEPVE